MPQSDISLFSRMGSIDQGRGNMRSALYYPHTSIRNEQLVKTALLLWDRLEYIVPWSHFRARHGSAAIQRAMELIGTPHCPDQDEKRETHTRLKELVSPRLPPQFYLNRQRGYRREASSTSPFQKCSPRPRRTARSKMKSESLRACPGGATIACLS